MSLSKNLASPLARPLATRLNGTYLGPELLLDGDFASATNWTGSATVSGGVVTFVNNTDLIQTSVPVVNSDVVEFTYTVVSNTSDGDFFLTSNIWDGVGGIIPSTVGTHTIQIEIVTPTNPFRVGLFSATTGSIVMDNCSVKTILKN